MAMITKEEFAAMQDHTAIARSDTEEDVFRGCEETLQYGFGAIYMWPCHIAAARKRFGNTIRIGTGIYGACHITNGRIVSALDAIEAGADNIDVMINISKIRSGDDAYAREELTAFTNACKKAKPDVTVKVLLEACYFNYEEKCRAIEAILASGADVIKTTSGAGPWACRPSDVRLIKSIVGDKIIIKAAGDMEDAGPALMAIHEGAREIGSHTAIIQMETFDQYIHLFD